MTKRKPRKDIDPALWEAQCSSDAHATLGEIQVGGTEAMFFTICDIIEPSGGILHSANGPKRVAYSAKTPYKGGYLFFYRYYDVNASIQETPPQPTAGPDRDDGQDGPPLRTADDPRGAKDAPGERRGGLAGHEVNQMPAGVGGPCPLQAGPDAGGTAQAEQEPVPQTIAIVRPWKRFAAVGCSHGPYIDPIARKSVIDFVRSYAPHRFHHLGDFTDLSALMGNGAGQGDPLAPDIDEGLAFLEELKAFKDLEMVIHEGNHEARLRRLAQSRNEVIAECSRLLLIQIEQKALALKAPLIEYKGIWSGSRLGNALLTHGSIFNEAACRDMAEMYCKDGVGVVISAHTHAPGMAMGRRDDNPLGVNVGTLTRRACMDYANNRRKTFSWGQAICFGEYCDDLLIPTLYVQPLALIEADQPWRIPA